MIRAADAFSVLVRAVARRPVAVLALMLALVGAGTALAVGLRPTAATDTLVNRDDPSFQATARYHRLFGDDSVIVLVRGSLRQLLLTDDLERVLGLEGCLSGNVPSGVSAPGACSAIARQHATQVVFGPGTFINEAATQIDGQLAAQTAAEQQQSRQAASAAYQLALSRHQSKASAQRLARQASSLVAAGFARTLLTVALQYGLRSPPSINDPNFVSTLVFDPLKALGTPKQRFAYLFPTPNAALIQVRLRPTLSDSERGRAIGLIRSAVSMSRWQLQHGGSYAVTGVPVIVSDLSGRITNSLVILLIAAILVMAATLALCFRARPRLLPLAIALAAAGLTFGALAASGASLTMASIGVLPVLIGLAVDYAIQFQSRYDEARRDAAAPEDAVALAARAGAPTIAAAGAATAGGFLVLALPVIGSPVPMVRDFGVLLVVGVALGFICALTAGSAALVLAGRPRRRALTGAPATRRLALTIGPSLRGAAELLAENRWVLGLRQRIVTAATRAFAFAVARPTRVLALALALSVIGWGLDTQTGVESDIQKLVPQNLQSLRNLAALQQATNVGGEIDVMVSAPDLTDPGVVSWMTGYEQRVLSRFGYSPTRGCGKAQLCPAFSLPDLFQTQGSTPSQASIRSLLDAVPPYFSQGVITPDRRVATLAFGIRLMPLDRQKQVIDAMRAQLHPPAGVQAQLVGLAVLAAEANAHVASPWRRIGTLIAGLVVVGLVLLGALRSARRAVIPLVPIVLATGWSALVLFVIGIPLNPMSVTLGVLVIAISTEFSVLLAERYRQEREAGLEPRAALERTYRSTGAAVLASGVTAIAGFGVLVFSDIRMLRDFGFVTLVDLTVSLLGVMLVLPSVLLLAERTGVVAGRLGARRRLRRRAAAA